MTTPPEDSDPTRTSSHPVPPPECPAHAAGSGGVRRLYGPEAEADFAALEERLRSQYGPVAPVLLHGDVPAWLILGFEENLAVMRNAILYSRDPRNWSVRLDASSPLAPLTAWEPLCNLTDGEEHARLRGAVTASLGGFERGGVRRYASRTSRLLIDEFAERGTADLVTEFAEHLPLRVVARLLGLSEDHMPVLVNAVRDMITGSATAVQSNEQVTRILQDLVEEKRQHPGHDIASWLIGHKAGQVDEATLQQEVREHLRLLLTATHTTTASLLASTLRLIFTDVRFRGSLNGGRLTVLNAVEQVLWDEPPFPRLVGRWATADHMLAEQPIRKGDLLVHALSAANRDPAIRPDPAAPVHENSAHLSFSAGEHACPGQDLARGIAEAGIDVLLERLPDMQLAVGLDQVQEAQALMSRRLDSLPVTFTPVRRHFGRPEKTRAATPAAPAAPAVAAR